MPNERQWEYACRADTTSAFSCGDTLLPDVAQYYASADKPAIIAADAKQPNPWGLKQMHGNVWEWCLDSYSETLSHQDPDTTSAAQHSPALSGELRILRGGSWLDDSENCRTAFRYYAPQQARANNIGLRMCCNATAENSAMDFIPFGD